MRTNIKFQRPRRSTLPVKLPIRFSNGVRVDKRFVGTLGLTLMGRRSANVPVNDYMRDMNATRTKLPCGALRKRTQAEFTHR